MPVNYDKLAEQFGGVDYDAIAGEFGGEQVDTKQRIARFGSETAELQKEAQTPLLKRFGQALPRATADVLLKQPARFAASAALAPIDIGRQLTGRKPISTELPFIGKTFQAKAQEELERGKSIPRVLGKAAFEVPLAGLETFGITKGAQAIGRGTKGLISSRREQKAFQEAVDIIKPKLTPKQQTQAFSAGRGQKTGLLRRVEVTPSARDLDTAEAVQGLVKKGKSEFENIKSLKNEIAKISDDGVRGALKKNNAIFNESQLRTRLNSAKEESEVVFAGDAALEKAYTATTNKFIEIVNKGKKNISNLFESRIEFDTFMKQKFGPDILDPTRSKDIVRTNAILDVRRSANEYISELLPKENVYKELLRKESLMFQAIKNIAGKAPKIGTTALQRFGARHPALKTTAKYGGTAVGGGIIAGLGLNRVFRE